MLVLYETAMGYALFKLTDSAKLTDPNLYKEFETPERANGLCVQIFSRPGGHSFIHSIYMLSIFLSTLGVM
jgi:NOP5NT (NUC127) domain